jgi:hypothetical protein
MCELQVKMGKVTSFLRLFRAGPRQRITPDLFLYVNLVAKAPNHF